MQYDGPAKAASLAEKILPVMRRRLRVLRHFSVICTWRDWITQTQFTTHKRRSRLLKLLPAKTVGFVILIFST